MHVGLIMNPRVHITCNVCGKVRPHSWQLEGQQRALRCLVCQCVAYREADTDDPPTEDPGEGDDGA